VWLLIFMHFNFHTFRSLHILHKFAIGFLHFTRWVFTLISFCVFALWIFSLPNSKRLWLLIAHGHATLWHHYANIRWLHPVHLENKATIQQSTLLDEVRNACHRLHPMTNIAWTRVISFWAGSRVRQAAPHLLVQVTNKRKGCLTCHKSFPNRPQCCMGNENVM
jgi:hypothetical protein